MYTRIQTVLCLLLVCTLSHSVARAQTYKSPDELQEMGLEDKVGAELPLDLEFTHSDGKRMKLGEFFNNDRPKMLLLVYYQCPMLCNLVLNSQVEALKDFEWLPGQEFDILTISINPNEKAWLAEEKKKTYVKQYDREGVADGWHWFVGEEENIRKLADTVGFKYFWNAEQEQYAHPAAVFIITPDGVLSRNLAGVIAPDEGLKELKLALFEAADRKVGGFVERIYLRCFHFDPSTGKYTKNIMFIMRLFSAALVLVVGGSIGVMLYVEKFGRRRRQAATATSGE